MKKGFFAYSSQPEFCENAIENAITEINSGDIVQISSWKGLRVNGKFIINEVLDAINKADFFCADLTGINDNAWTLLESDPLLLIKTEPAFAQ